MNAPEIIKAKAFGVRPDVPPSESAFSYRLSDAQNQLIQKVLTRRQWTKEVQQRLLRVILEEWGIRHDLQHDPRLTKGEAMLILTVLLDSSAMKAAEQRMQERFFGQGRLV